MAQYKLCYICPRHNRAYFTTAPLEQQWADDWNDAPYEHNAGLPYEWSEYMQKKGIAPYKVWSLVYFCNNLETPAEKAGSNSHYSVQQINQQQVPWLSPSTFASTDCNVVVFAGVTVEEFKQKIWEAGGEVFLPASPLASADRHKIAYLTGPMEFANDYGEGWRGRLKQKLAAINIQAIIPNDEERKFISGQEELNQVKRADPVRYQNIMRLFIKQDLQFVEQADMIITYWEGERMSGTIGEAQHAYLYGTPAYLVTSKSFQDIPGWFGACYDRIFHTEDKLIEYLESQNA